MASASRSSSSRRLNSSSEFTSGSQSGFRREETFGPGILLGNFKCSGFIFPRDPGDGRGSFEGVGVTPEAGVPDIEIDREQSSICMLDEEISHSTGVSLSSVETAEGLATRDATGMSTIDGILVKRRESIRYRISETSEVLLLGHSFSFVSKSSSMPNKSKIFESDEALCFSKKKFPFQNCGLDGSLIGRLRGGKCMDYIS